MLLCINPWVGRVLCRETCLDGSEARKPGAGAAGARRKDVSRCRGCANARGAKCAFGGRPGDSQASVASVSAVVSTTSSPARKPGFTPGFGNTMRSSSCATTYW